MAQYYEENKITFQQLVMGQIKIIQNISAKELRDGTKVVKSLIGEQTLEGEDSRFSYLQSVEMLGSLLSPYFSPTVQTDFDNFTHLYDLELMDAIKDKDFVKDLALFFNKKDMEEAIKNDEKIRNQANVYLLNYKIKDARVIFRSLVKLFKEKDFLSEQSYGEGGGAQKDDSLDAEVEEEGEIAE